MVHLPQFQTKFKNAKFDEDNSIIGWKSKCNEDENPKNKLKQKAIVELDSDGSWKSHCREYGSNSKSKKILLVDLGIAMCDKEIDR